MGPETSTVPSLPVQDERKSANTTKTRKEPHGTSFPAESSADVSDCAVFFVNSGQIRDREGRVGESGFLLDRHIGAVLVSS